MPLRRSPPAESTRSKSILKNSLFADQSLGSNAASLAEHNVMLTTSPNICSSLEQSTMSWSIECLTPTTGSETFSIPTSAITITSTYCSSTTSNSVKNTTTSPATTTTVSVLAPVISSTASSTSSTSLKITTASPTLHNKTASAPLSGKESSKRSRSSPAKICEKVCANKKQKTKNVLKVAKPYWLGEHPTSSNRFATLDSLQDSNKNSDNYNKNVLPCKEVKPPPIYVQNVERIGILQNALNGQSELKYELKILKNNEVRITCTNLDHYNNIIAFLKTKETEFYTFKPKNLIGFKVFLRDMHYSTDVEDIKNELLELGHEVTNIRNVLHTHTKSPLSLFSLELKTNINNSDIFKITELLHCKIKFEKPYKTRSLPQCTNCQKYGHTKNFCTKTPVCVKCAGNHKSSQCSDRLDRKSIKCALCNENHTANYKGCSIYKLLRDKNKTPPAKFEEAMPAQPTKNNLSSNIVKPSLSFSQAVSTNLPSSASSIEPTEKLTGDNDISELKDMMKQLMLQVSNMLSIINVLIKNLNVNSSSK